MAPADPTANLRASIEGPVRRLGILFGDQLAPVSPLTGRLDPERDAILMMEVAGEAEHPPSHRQRTILFLAAMRHRALDLVRAGWRVRYVRLDARDNTGSFDGEVRRAVGLLKPRELVAIEPGDRRVEAALAAWQADLAPVTILMDDRFTCDRETFAGWAAGRKRMVMEHFYRFQRKRLDILIDADGGPVGGEWNFDAENRAAFKEAPDPPAPYRPRPDAVTRGVIDLVAKILPDAPGDADSFAWPVTRRQARRALTDFVAHRLPRFGTHQDAMWTGEPWLYHSLLASSLNLGLLGVRETVDAAVKAYDEGAAPLNAVEGFVRQVIGWREFVRGVYWTEDAGYRDRNGLGHDGRLPDFYWTGDTSMVCLKDAVGQVLDHGYGHHIQRLMVTGNFALTAGVDPAAVNDWYLGMYVDAVDWVTAPNVVGMTLHADGGVVGTKPYASTGRYIDRMSNACKSCPFDPTRRTGDDACPFTVFYWDFLMRHRKRFATNPRMRMMMKNLERIDDDEKKAIRAHARALRNEFGITPDGG